MMFSENTNKEYKKSFSKEYIIVFLLFIICVLSSFYKLDFKYINVDEAGTILNATTLLKYGTDRMGVSWPLYPNNYYSGQSILPTMLVYLSLMLFGNNLFAARLPYAAVRVICSFFVYKTFKEDRRLSTILLFLYSVFPFFVMSSRFVLDCNLLLYVLIIAVFFMIRYFKTGKVALLLMSGIMFGLSFYCYALAYLIIPLFIIIYFLYLLRNKQITIKRILVFLTPVILLGIPLLIRLVVDLRLMEPFTVFGITFNKILSYRSSEVGLNHFKLSNVFQLINCIFINDNFNVVSYGVGGPCLYLPLALLAYYLFVFVKKKKYEDPIYVLFITLYVCCFTIGLFLDRAISWRMNAIFVPILFISGISLNSIDYKYRVICVSILLLLFFGFSFKYFTNYGKDYASVLFDNGIYELFKEAKSMKKDIYIKNSRIGEEYVYYFLFDESIDLKDYPKDYYPYTIRDEKNNITIFQVEDIDINAIDKNVVYLTFNKNHASEEYPLSDNFIKNGSWTLWYFE